VPYSATERFSRTYTPRVPDDSYDSLGGTAIPNSIVTQLPERPFEYALITTGFSAAVLAQTIVPSGQRSQFNISTTFTSGALTTQAETASTELDELGITTAMAGGTLAT
jgi:hypothetical protein